MKTAQMKNTVTVYYTGRLENGEIFDAATEKNPLRFELGGEGILPGFSAAIIGMGEGESKEFTLSPDQAFGEKKSELIQTLPPNSFGEEITPKPGMILGMTVEKDGIQHKVPALVTEVSNEMVSIDFNHPLAGKTLYYQITVKAIE